MEILHLNVKKKWFDMIASGEKKEEYRELKTYWAKRLVLPPEIDEHGIVSTHNVFFKEFDAVLFRNGYSKNAPQILLECKSIKVGKPRKGWCDEYMVHRGIDYFVISLGQELDNPYI